MKEGDNEDKVSSWRDWLGHIALNHQSVTILYKQNQSGNSGDRTGNPLKCDILTLLTLVTFLTMEREQRQAVSLMVSLSLETGLVL